MLSLKERSDKLIQATDLDALSCRNSINLKSYLIPNDDYIIDLINSYHLYLQFCTGYSSISSSRTLKSIFKSNKLPIINRGSYLRTRAIDQVIEKFINVYNQNCQIISLGSGSDTRAFKFLTKYPNILYHEIDFPESVKIKKLAILKNVKLRNIIDYQQEESPNISSKEDFQNFPSNLATNNYNLHGIDLRTLNSSSKISNFNSNLPTLIISECVLCYLSPEDYVKNITFWEHLNNELTCFLIYEPMSLNDRFGETMTRNLLDRGLNLKLFNKYPNLETRKDFLRNNCQLTNLKLTSLSNIGGYDDVHKQETSWIDIKEMKRVNSLEFIDEIEEIRLLLKHYCICYGEFKKFSEIKSFHGINDWDWDIIDDN
ncbi:unnamed protein product [Candida verbasci]|uniref:Leucine carboxyl methyltransferase 1 n=1 Tax=Candida verbasci TaxID=1227364 RepID=A0A9W4TT34_9ASCO|nr:unnamed protein product [Candida verbasci]